MNNNALIEIINENGLSILEHSEELFKKLILKFSQEETALLLLIFSRKELLNELKKKNKKQDDIVKTLCEIYHFNHEYALLISENLLIAFSDKQLDVWDANYKKGVYEFMNSCFKCSNQVCTCWSPKYSYCYLECSLNYELKIRVREDRKVLEFINAHFKNEFVKKNAIINVYKSLIHEAIEKDFIYYCTCDDECEPICEEYDEDVLDTLSEKYGLEIEILKWNGFTSNYMT